MTTPSRRPSLLSPLALILLAAAPFGCQIDSADCLGATSAPSAAPVAPPPAISAGGETSRIAFGADKYVSVIDGKEVPPPDIKMGDPAVVSAILREGRDHSMVMNHITYLTQQIGPRLTGSSNAKKANDWAQSLYAKWGLTNPHIEQWGTIGMGFDRGLCTGRILMPEDTGAPRGRQGGGRAAAAAPAEAGADKPAEPKAPEWKSVRDMQFTTLAWTRGTDGPVKGPVRWLPKSEEDYKAVKDKLKGCWILMDPPPALGGRGIGNRIQTGYQQRAEARKKVKDGTELSEIPIAARVSFDGIAGYITTSRDERVWTTSLTGWRDLTPEAIPPEVSVIIRLSDYDFINSRLADNEEFQVEFDLKHTFNPGPVPVYNTVAEIVGTEKPDEVVIVSAHMDSWNGPGSQGCTDNGTGTATVIEAARILATVGVKPKRTIRFINYTGEEQGLLGSKGYVESHKSEMSKISACFVDDGGTNYEGGLNIPPQMVPYLAAATAPVNNQFYDTTDNKFLNVDIKTAKRAAIAKGGSSDHASFNAAGVPGFYWEEVGRAEYPFGWHTQNDKLDLAIPMYLAQSATNMAVVAYNLACAPDLLPRSVEEPGKEEPVTPPTDPSKKAAPTASK